MSEFSYSIQRATLSDLPVLADLLYTSKLPLTINRLLWHDWPNEGAQRAQYSRAAEGGLNDLATETFKVIDDGSGETVGHLYLTRHKSAESKDDTKGDDKNYADGRDKEKQKPSRGLNQEVAAAVGGATAEIEFDKDFEYYRAIHVVGFAFQRLITTRNHPHLRCIDISPPWRWFTTSAAGD
jgi:hypothetical protein